ncbi:phosphoenolpyruvate--protein phosphotransferase [Zooshikella sp. RANM57]|uniref:phosphoenolpyruvate--protein phosphotransferase n=1 Tax=Zooshikella sp. RANM57 TaxID=3425863 RepID=UPI003D6E69D1
MKSFTFSCELANGVHARPASYIEALCSQFNADITWQNKRTGITCNAKSVLALIGTDTLLGDECVLCIEGLDEEQALQKITQFIRNEFVHCDAPLSSAQAGSSETLQPLPRNLTNLNVNYIRGLAVSEGIGQGKLLTMGTINFDHLGDLPTALSHHKEQRQLDTGLKTLIASLTIQFNTAEYAEKEVLKAHLAIAKDPEFQQHLSQSLVVGGRCADAIIATVKHFAERMKHSASRYMRERELDIRDVCYQLLQSIYSHQHFANQSQLTEPTVVLADDLTPSQFLELDKSMLQGVILSCGGSTSHTVILARSFAIPTIVGIEADQLTSSLRQLIIIDGNLGVVITERNTAIERYYQQEQWIKAIVSERQAKFRNQPAYTADGKPLEVAANIAHSVEAKQAFVNGAESVGLFRTEMLYMDRNTPPDEDELYNILCQACEAADGKAIIVRTIDIGGDKPVDYLNIPAENNPFLGYRAVRIYSEFIDLFKTQLRAILRASVHGNLKIMIPMISAFEEILWVKDVLAEVRQGLRKDEVAFAEKVPLGIMLEVPSVVFILDQCCKEVDFFSIGSNDLTQYLLAVDRDNSKVVQHYNSLNPAFLRTLDYAVRQVHHYGKWIGLCGELGAKGSVLPLLVGLGLDEISMNSPSIPATKEHIAKLNNSECRQLLNQAKQCRTVQEVEHILAQFRMDQTEAPMVSRDCIILDQDLRSKEEVIKALADNLFLTGRCRYPNKLADDLWAREDVFSTGLGFGFAIPHTKSEHIEQSAISVCRLDRPIQWGDEEAQFIIMLTLNKHAAGDQHMKIFSKLARKIMHVHFREQLMKATDSEQIESLLKHELELT